MRFLVFLYIVWLIRTLHGVCLFTYLWQLKEYRLDRMMDLWSTPKGRGYFLNLFTGLQLLLLLFLWIARYNEKFIVYIGWAVAVVFLAESLQALLQLVSRKMKRPKLTFKSLLLLFLTTGVTLAASLYFLEWNVVSPDFYRLLLVLLVFALLLSDINALMVFALRPFIQRAKHKVYEKALKKRLSFGEVKVVGITGSFGKTTTKEFLKAILSEKFSTYATKGNVNTEIGVANAILQDMSEKYDVFIVEMGAYRKGEIRTICELARPDIGILTGINEQHVGLFGSIERTMEAKFELMESLPSKGLAVFNGDNEYCLMLSEGVKTPKVLYSLEEGSDIWAGDIVVKQDRVNFTVHVHDDSFSAEARITGKHNILNVLACVSVALELGMSFDEIRRGISKLAMPKRTMEIIHKGDMVLIDDTYNTNTNGIYSVLEYMKEGYPDYKRIVVFPGILELGAQSEEIHVTLGTEIAKNADLFIISHTDFAKPLLRGARLGGMNSNQVLVIDEPAKVLSKLKHMEGKKIILFESRGMENVLTKLQVL